MITSPAVPALSEIEDFELVSLVLGGKPDAVDELLNRVTVPASLALKLAAGFLRRLGTEVPELPQEREEERVVELLLQVTTGERRFLRMTPDRANLREWMRFVALGYLAQAEGGRNGDAASHGGGARRGDEAPQREVVAQAALPLESAEAPALAPPLRLALGLLGDGCRAPALARVLGVSLDAAANLAYEARRAVLRRGSATESPCGVAESVLSAYVDHALAAEVRADLRDHVNRCPACGRRMRLLRAASSQGGGERPSGRCVPLSWLFRYGRRELPVRVRVQVEEHAGRCRSCRRALLFDRTYAPFAPPVEVRVSQQGMAEGRRRILAASGAGPPLAGFGISPELCRVLYTTGVRGTDVFTSGSRVVVCEGTSLRLGNLSIQIKCLPEVVEGDERCSLGVVFTGVEERLPVFLDQEGEGEKQVTLREGSAEFRFLRMGCHALRFGRFKGQVVLVDIKPCRPRFLDLARAADALHREAEEVPDPAAVELFFYRLSDLTLQAAALRPGDPRALLRLLRIHFAKPGAAFDASRLSQRVRPADRSAYQRFLAAGTVRAIAWAKAASADSRLGDDLRPLARVFVAYEAKDSSRLRESLALLRARALPDDAETDRYARSLHEWLEVQGASLREDLVLRLGAKYVDGLVARYDRG